MKLTSAIVRQLDFEPSEDQLSAIKQNIRHLVEYAVGRRQRVEELEIAILKWRSTRGRSNPRHWHCYTISMNALRQRAVERGEKSQWWLNRIAPADGDWTQIEKELRAKIAGVDYTPPWLQNKLLELGRRQRRNS